MTAAARARVRTRSLAIYCPASWDEMSGSDTVRHCATCRKDVYDLSAMTEEEASALLEASEPRCVRFYYRPVTAAPSRPVAGMALVVATTFAGIAATTADPPCSDAAATEVAMGVGLIIRPRGPRHERREGSERPFAEPHDESLKVADVAPSLAPSTPAITTPHHRGFVGILAAGLFLLAAILTLGIVRPAKRAS